MNRVILILLCTLVSSCTSYKRCVDKYGQQRDTVYVTYEKHIPVEVTVPKDSISGSVSLRELDSIPHMEVKEINDSTSNITIQYWIDRYTDLLYLMAVQPEYEIHDTIFVRDTLPCPPCPPELVKSVTKVEKLKNKYAEIASWALPAVLITLLIVARWKK